MEQYNGINDGDMINISDISKCRTHILHFGVLCYDLPDEYYFFS